MSTVVGSAEDMAEVGRMAGDAMEGWLRDYDGFCGLIVLTDEEGERARVITFWESAEAEQRSRPGRIAMRDRLTATVGMRVEGMEVYEVPVLDMSQEPMSGGQALP
jgi:hypothetical protein